MGIPRGKPVVGPGTWSVDLVAGGTFSRSTEASYQTSAPTDGTVAFMSFATANTRVFENMGDGAGSLLRIEGARTNLCVQCRKMGTTPWGGISGFIITENSGPSPDGGNNGTKIDSNTTGNWSGYQPVASYTAPLAMSGWGILISGGPAWYGYDWAVGSGNLSGGNMTGVWGRRYTQRVSGTSANPYVYVRAGGSGVNIVFIADLLQWEEGEFPSSVIRTTTTSLTRSADALTFTSAALPSALFTGAGEYTQVAPEFANTDLVSGDTFWLWAIDANNGMRIKHDGSNVVVQAVQGGSVKASSGALTFSRNGLLGIVKWDPSAAVVTVNGVAGSVGTPWAWGAANIRIGGVPSSTGEAFCRFGLLQSA